LSLLTNADKGLNVASVPRPIRGNWFSWKKMSATRIMRFYWS